MNGLQNKNNESEVELRKQFVEYALKFNFKEAANRFNIDPRTISKWVKRFKQYGVKGLENKVIKNRSHSNETKDFIKDKIITYKKKNPIASLNDIKKALSLDCNIITISRILNKNNLIPKNKNSRNKFIDMKAIVKFDPFETLIFSYKELKVNRTYKVRNKDFAGEFNLNFKNICGIKSFQLMNPV